MVTISTPSQIPRVRLGRTGLSVSRIGLASNGIPRADVEYAVERGVNYLYWGTRRLGDFGDAVRHIARRRRDEVTIVVQSYTRIGSLLRPSLERALRRLGIEYADLLLLGWWNEPPPPRILDAAAALRVSGKARAIMVSCHNRSTFRTYIDDPNIGAIMVRYNAAHPGAESDVFPLLGEDRAGRPGVVTYTATRWGALLDPQLLPRDERRPRPSDCYRFALSHPDANVTLCGAKNRDQLDEALSAIERGPMQAEELAWMKRVGAAVKQRTSVSRSGNLPIFLLDRLTRGRTTSAPRR
ncbi:MAG: hypothetical protein HOW73_28445 [Polyangiaceae bacterium]|nr:hypothetical protein [Polyangiaceae bacterium]